MNKLQFFIASLCFITINTLHTSDTTKPLTADDCRAPINVKKIANMEPYDALQKDVACIKAGHKKILLTSQRYSNTEKFKDMIKDLSLKELICLTTKEFYYDQSTLQPVGDPKMDPSIIYYKDDLVKKDALLLQKYSLESTLSKYVSNISAYIQQKPSININILNHYGQGKLLQYAEEDITLLYQRNALSAEELKSIGNNPQKIKVWADKNTHIWKPLLDKNKAAYTLWLELNKDLTIEQLEKQNTTLNEAIKHFIPVPSQQKIPVVPNISWLHKSKALGVALLAVGGIAFSWIYRYFAGKNQNSIPFAPK